MKLCGLLVAAAGLCQAHVMQGISFKAYTKAFNKVRSISSLFL
jgi:F0F1-type ATP synthase membrane subunit c/vacuolar-type H+-ATPase subunit K